MFFSIESLLSRERRLVQKLTRYLQSTAIWLKGKADPREAGDPGLIPGRGSKIFFFYLVHQLSGLRRFRSQSPRKEMQWILGILLTKSLLFVVLKAIKMSSIALAYCIHRH